MFVEVKKYLYVPGQHLNVITFEVKPADSIDVSAVYEALAHLRSATHAYVVLHTPENRAAALGPSVEDVCVVARSHGIGVIAAGDPSDFSTWDELVEAVRQEPDPERLNTFIATQVSRSTRDAVTTALR